MPHRAAQQLPSTIQRITQFHDLVLTNLRNAGRFPVMPLPSGLQFQSIDTRDAARRLVDLTDGQASGRATDIGGPLVQTIKDLARQYLTAAGPSVGSSTSRFLARPCRPTGTGGT